MQKTVVFKVQKARLGELKSELLKKLEFREVSNMHGQEGVAWQLMSDIGTVTAYTSEKVVIQARETEILQGLFAVVKLFTEESTSTFVPHIGVDEAGKGDYFGPLVVGAVFVEGQEVADELRSLGVRDSKSLSDRSAINLREEILGRCKYCEEVVLTPDKYNELYAKMKNVNKLLAWGHARAIESILDRAENGTCTSVVIDQFAKSEGRILDALMEKGKCLKVTQMHRGEADVAVAAASILARGRFLIELRKLGEKHNIILPKGASNVVGVAKSFVAKHGEASLRNVAKVSFKTTGKVLQYGF